MLTKTKPEKIYCEKVEVSDNLQEQLSQCCRNHLVLYNQVLEHFRQNKAMTYRELRDYTTQLVDSSDLKPVIKEIVLSDIYHMHKKSDYKQKLITSIQYLSLIVTDYYSNRNLEYKQKAMTLRFRAMKGRIFLPKELPPIEFGDSVYLNLSYSADSGFELAIFKM